MLLSEILIMTLIHQQVIIPITKKASMTMTDRSQPERLGVEECRMTSSSFCTSNKKKA